MILPVGYLPNNEHLKDNAFSMAFPGMMPTIYWYESMSLIVARVAGSLTPKTSVSSL